MQNDDMTTLKKKSVVTNMVINNLFISTKM